jgi:lysophospholipid acyltransferase (LPLAT)-like uncharacterized protein
MGSLGDRLLLAVAPRLGHAYIRLLGATMRLDYRGREVLELARSEAGHYILAFWHSRFVMMPYAYPDRRLVVLVSQHRDARLLARILERFGLEVAYGSSTARGARALRELVQRLREGRDGGIAPDGPRGPRRRVKPGVLAAARLSGLPIVPVGFSACPARRLRSWDRTLVPRPFSRGLFVYGAPFRVSRQADAAELARRRVELECELDRLTDLADAAVGLEQEDPRPPAATA